MSYGEFLGVTLLVFLVVWLLADLIIWLSGRETLSQWIIKESKKRLAFNIMALVVTIGLAAILVWHWELIPILIEHLEAVNGFN